MTILCKSGRNYSCCKWDDNLCDGGSVLICVIRRQSVENVEGKCREAKWNEGCADKKVVWWKTSGLGITKMAREIAPNRAILLTS